MQRSETYRYWRKFHFSCQTEMTEMCTRHPIHVIIDRQIAYVCETDQRAEFHIILTLI